MGVSDTAKREEAGPTPSTLEEVGDLASAVIGAVQAIVCLFSRSLAIAPHAASGGREASPRAG